MTKSKFKVVASRKVQVRLEEGTVTALNIVMEPVPEDVEDFMIFNTGLLNNFDVTLVPWREGFEVGKTYEIEFKEVAIVEKQSPKEPQETPAEKEKGTAQAWAEQFKEPDKPIKRPLEETPAEDKAKDMDDVPF